MAGLGVVLACPDPMMTPMLGPRGLAREMHTQEDISQGLGHGGEALALAGGYKRGRPSCLYELCAHTHPLHCVSSRYCCPLQPSSRGQGLAENSRPGLNDQKARPWGPPVPLVSTADPP